MDSSSIAIARTGVPSAVEAVRATQPAKDVAQSQETKASDALDYSPNTLRSQQNQQILQASMEVSIQAGDNSMALLYRAAIDSINAELEPFLGPDALNASMAAGVDHSPEGTAGRILSMSTAFFDTYAEKYKDKDPETVARDFVNLIRGGFERGFGEASDILSGLGVMGQDSPIEQGINKTYALVMQGYDDFLASKLGPRPEASTPPAEGGKDTKAA